MTLALTLASVLARVFAAATLAFALILATARMRSGCGALTRSGTLIASTRTLAFTGVQPAANVFVASLGSILFSAVGRRRFATRVSRLLTTDDRTRHHSAERCRAQPVKVSARKLLFFHPFTPCYSMNSKASTIPCQNPGAFWPLTTT